MTQRWYSQVVIQDKTIQRVFVQLWFTPRHINITLTLSLHCHYRIRDSQQASGLNHSHWFGKSFDIGQRKSRHISLVRLVKREEVWGQ